MIPMRNRIASIIVFFQVTWALWLLIGILALAGAIAGPAIAQPTSAMRNAVVSYADDYAQYEDWRFLRMLPTQRGDYRRGHFWLLFDATDRADSGKNVEFDLRVEATAQRCSLGQYAVSTPYDESTCWEWKW